MSSGAVSGGGGSRTNPSWLQYSSFHANDTMITIVPNFSSTRPLSLLSCEHAKSVGPFVAGMPCKVPLWMAKLLHQRQLAQIQLPDWLSSTPTTVTTVDGEDNPFPSATSISGSASYLVQALHEEKTQSSLLPSNRLPFYYYEIARALSPGTAGSGVGGVPSSEAVSSSSTSLVGPSTQLVIQDLHTVRVDKIRQHFHELSREELSRTYMDAEHTEPTHMIEVTGIASMELAAVGPFLKQAFTDYGILCQKTDDEDERKEDGTGAGRNGDGIEKENDNEFNRDGAADGDGSPTTSKADRQRKNLLRSRLRRFRS